MENLIQLSNGHKAYGSRVLFDLASFAINEKEHVGVIGPNGAGKTTLFRILSTEETLDSGSLIRSRSLRMGYLSQHDNWAPELKVEDFISQEALLAPWELRPLGKKLGLTEDHYNAPMGSLSGGYRMRVKLLQLLGKEPNLMLLDEPTNYLDLETVLVLERFLQEYEGAFLLISHDREFLKRTTDHTLEVEGGEITKYNGNIDDYFEQKELLRQQLEARALSVSEKKKEILDFVNRFGAKATKARQAQSRLKTLAKMETIEIKPLPVRARLPIPAPERPGRLIASLNNVDLGYPAKTVLSRVHLRLEWGQHLAVVGVNGAGKSTLLKALAGRLSPQHGTLERGDRTSFAYFGQHVAEELSLEDTVLESLQKKAHPSVLPQDILNLAGGLLFSGSEVGKRVKVLSGGERARVALGQVLLQKSNCLILDEPTNHLDFTTVESLTQALEKFAGAVVVVSHDRGFIRRIGTQILEVNQGRAAFYPGTYDEYVWSLQSGRFQTLESQDQLEQPSLSPAQKQKKQGSTSLTSFTSSENIEKGFPSGSSPTASGQALSWEEKKNLQKKLRQLERKLRDAEALIAEQHKRIEELNHEVQGASDLAIQSKNVQEMGRLQQSIETLEEQWLQNTEELDQVQKQLGSD